MAAASQEDLVIAAVVVVLALVGFIAVLYLNSKGSKGGRRGGPGTPTPVKSIPADGVGTVYVKEGGQVVRRSTRQHKPMTPVATRISAAGEDATPARTPRTATKTAARSPAPGTTPETPASTRRGRPARA